MTQERQVHSKPLSWFKTNSNIRKAFDLDGLWLLASTLKVKQLVPLICRSDRTILDGERRYRAAMLEGKPDHLDVIITDEPLSPGQLIELQFVTLQREGIRPIDRFHAYMEWKRLNPDLPWKVLAEMTGEDPATISTIISLDKCIPQAQEAAAKGLLSISDWTAMSRGTPEEQLSMLTAKLNGECVNRDQLRRKRTIRLDVPEVQAKRLKCPIPGTGITLSFAGTGVTISSAIEAAKTFIAEAQDAVKRKITDGKVFEKMCKERDQAKKEEPKS